VLSQGAGLGGRFGLERLQDGGLFGRRGAGALEVGAAEVDGDVVDAVELL
jgi:hypothetical protein